MKHLALLALFLTTACQSKPYQFYGYPEAYYQPIYEDLQNYQPVQEFAVENPSNYPDQYILEEFALDDSLREVVVIKTYEIDENRDPVEFENIDTRGEFVIEADGSTFIGSESDNPSIFEVGTPIVTPDPVVPISSVSVIQVENQPGVKKDIIEVADENGNFKTLLQIIRDLNLVDFLKYANALTIFAPTDDAFAKLPEGTLDDLSAEEKTKIIQRHVVIYTIPINKLYYGKLNTMGGEDVLVETDENLGNHEIKYNEETSKIVNPDIKAKNGVIHAIDKVIL